MQNSVGVSFYAAPISPGGLVDSGWTGLQRPCRSSLLGGFLRLDRFVFIVCLTSFTSGGAALAEPCADRSPERNVYWGELHVHTGLSGDAWRSDVRTTPDQAYRFARGDAIAIAPLGADGLGTQTIQLARPLDFAAVTDHAEWMGVAAICNAPGHPLYDGEWCRLSHRLPATPAFKRPAGVPPRRVIHDALCGEEGQVCIEAMKGPWRQIRQAAASHLDETSRCEFTTFVAYEWSGARGGPLLHRNVIFRNATATPPASSAWFPRPRDLRRHLERDCLQAEGDCDVLVIPHNSNTSQGQMWTRVYEDGESERAQAQRIRALEPLVEVMQHKGDSECRNGLSRVLGGVDELCEFEKLFPAEMPECMGGEAIVGNAVRCTDAGGYARYGLAIGIAEQQRLGVNPYQYGLIAATDAHNGNAGQVAEWDWQGHVGNRDASFAARTSSGLQVRNTVNGPGGLAAVWAEENSREALFAAMRRRETYGTSGPRMTVRLFGGWGGGLPAALCDEPDFVAQGYAHGVPMGGVLAKRAGQQTTPTFAVRALRDPGSAGRPGTALQRIQIIKVWPAEDGAIEQRVYDVVGDARNGASVDPDTCEPRGPGADQLCAVWSDPAFDPAQAAAYYARVVENPSCRWLAHDCLRLPKSGRPEVCRTAEASRPIQERAWTSPIWYSPDGG